MGKVLTFWLTPKFPRKHIESVLSFRPQGLKNRIRNFYRTWLVHPVKRRAAKYYLWFLRRFFRLKVIGITGSAGKTTTKEMLASILRQEGEAVFSFANIDPIYNIPATILRCRPGTRFLILEMGVEYPGEMDFYLWLARPDVGIILNVYPTHTLFFKNADGVFREKSKLVKGLSAGGVAVLNRANEYLRRLKGHPGKKVVWFGEEADVSASDIRFSRDFRTNFVLKIGQNRLTVSLPILGKQFVENSLAAGASADALGIGLGVIKRGLESFKSQEHRMEIKSLRSGAVLIDDSYNNNPEAAKAAIETLKSVSGGKKTMIVFGDMLELGKSEKSYHKEIGEAVRRAKIDYVIGVGRLSGYVVVRQDYRLENWEKAVPVVKSLLSKDLVVLVKGSRSIGLDNLVARLTSNT